LQAQWLNEYRSFSTDFVENRYNFNIRLFLNGKYQILHSDIGGPVTVRVAYFSGNYIEKDKKLILIDEFTKLQLEYQCIYDTVQLSPDYSNPIRVTIRLIPVKTFDFLQNFTFTGNTIIYPDSAPYKSTSRTCQTIDEFKQQNKNQKLGIGNYKSTDPNASIRLRIEKDKRYYLYSFKFLLSSGKWRRKGEKLILQDSTLNQEIYGIIGTNRILLHTGYELQYVKE
jgi:hypothetical protein